MKRSSTEFWGRLKILRYHQGGAFTASGSDMNCIWPNTAIFAESYGTAEDGSSSMGPPGSRDAVLCQPESSTFTSTTIACPMHPLIPQALQADIASNIQPVKRFSETEACILLEA